MKRNFLLGAIVLCLLAHLAIFWQRTLMCEEDVGGEGRGLPGGGMLVKVKMMDRKLDELEAAAVGKGGDGASMTTSLIGLRGRIDIIMEEWKKGIGGGSLENFGSHNELSDKIEAVIESMKEASGPESVGLAVHPERKKIKTFIGVFTGFQSTAKQDNPEDTLKYNYALRRKALRETWFPSNTAERDSLEEKLGIVTRFVLGHTEAKDIENEIDEEARKNKDFLRLPIMESRKELANKTKTFFGAVAAMYDADWVVKVDDDVYFMIDRLPLAQIQWQKMQAGYIGCMRHGHVWKEESSPWYEPRHLLIGAEYYLHAIGNVYVVSRKVMEEVIVRNYHMLRVLAKEDATVGSWMLSHNVTHFEDRRLCATRCSQAAIGILRDECGGLCHPQKDLYMLHRSRSCQSEVKAPLPYLPSHRDNKEFEDMRV